MTDDEPVDWSPPQPADYATRWPGLRHPGDLIPRYCCDTPWVNPLHAPNCPDRCTVCGSEGWDNDHRDGCPLIGTPQQFW